MKKEPKWSLLLSTLLTAQFYSSTGINFSEDRELFGSTCEYLKNATKEEIIHYTTSCSMNADVDRWFKACNCGKSCLVYGECCNDTVRQISTNSDFQLEPIMLELKLTGGKMQQPINFDANLYVKKRRCLQQWNSDDVREKCEIYTEHPTVNFDNGNITSILRVTVIDKNLTYPNVFCALCNGERNYEFWDVTRFCWIRGCDYYQRPDERIYSSLWFRWPANFIRLLTVVDEDKKNLQALKSGLCSRLVKLTEKLHYGMRPDTWFFHYTFNYYENITNASTKLFDQTRPVNKLPRPLHDIFKSDNRPDLIVCKDSTFYDPFAGKTRKIVCEPDDECIKFRLDPGEFNVTYRGLHVGSYNRTFPWSKFRLASNGSIAQICLADAMEGANSFQPSSGLITTVGLIVSTISLTFHLAVHFFFTAAYTLPSNNLTSFSLSLLLAHVSFAVGDYLAYGTYACKLDAISTHYFFLVSFVWTSVISYDVSLTLTKCRKVSGKRADRFLFYSAVAWLLPLTITFCAVTLDYVNVYSNWLKAVDLRPEFGKISCWFKNGPSAVVFFVFPVFSSIVFNVYCFWRCVRVIARRRNEFTSDSTVHVKRDLNENFYVYCKLSILTGITWSSAFVAAFFDHDFLWNIFIVLNSFQGVFVFLAFTDKRPLLNAITTLLLFAIRRKTDNERSNNSNISNNNNNNNIRVTIINGENRETEWTRL